MKKYVCTICGFIYDEAVGIPSAGIQPGTKWEDLPDNWVCPLCGAAKTDFKEQADMTVEKSGSIGRPDEGSTRRGPKDSSDAKDLRALTVGELSALCSNLARGCEKQYLSEESGLFTQLSEYFKSKTHVEERADYKELLNLIDRDLNDGYPNANAAAGAEHDRGALRALTWGEKVTRILNSLLTRYEKEGPGFLEHTNLYVCDTCGFIYAGDNPPELCPVCKVPSWKFTKIERR